MSPTKPFISILLLIFSLYSCHNHDSATRQLLTQAQEIIESNPKQALALLDSIASPKDMGKDAHMQYIVAHVEAKRRNDISVACDTLVFEAQDYFNHKGDIKQATYANYYAGMVSFQAKIWDKAIDCYRQTIQYASQTEDNLMLGKAYHTLGTVFYNNNLLDSAIVNYRQALDFYDKTDHVDLFKMQVLTSMDISYNRIYKYDEAEDCINQCSVLAKQTGNQAYQGYCNQNLGVIRMYQDDYNAALDYFRKALPDMQSTIDSLLIYLNISKAYTQTARLDSAIHYMNIAKEHEPQIKEDRTLTYFYSVLNEYYEKEKNYAEALHYSTLHDSVRQVINKGHLNELLKRAEMKREMAVEYERAAAKKNILIVGVVAANIILLLLGMIVYYRMRSKISRQQLAQVKQELEKIRLAETMEAERTRFFQFNANLHYKITNEWQEISKKISALEIEYGKTEDVLKLYPRMGRVVNNVHKQICGKLIVMGKEFLLEEPNGEAALECMKDSDILSLMMTYHNFSIHAMGLILGKPFSQKDFNGCMWELQCKLRLAHFSEERIQELLFSNDQTSITG